MANTPSLRQRLQPDGSVSSSSSSTPTSTPTVAHRDNEAPQSHAEAHSERTPKSPPRYGFSRGQIFVALVIIVLLIHVYVGTSVLKVRDSPQWGWHEKIWAWSPFIVVMGVAVYSAASIAHSLLAFNRRDDAARGLQEDVEDMKRQLRSLGLQLK